MDLAQIRELLEMVAESGVSEVEIEEDDFKLTVRKSAPQVMVQPASPFGMAGFPPPYQQQQGYAPPQGQPMPPGQPMPAQGAAQGPGASAPQQAPSQGAPAPSQGGAPTEAEEAPAGASGNEVTVPAPIVGTFYRASSPEADPFVEVGDAVQPGDVLCIIEAMKLMNEIECEQAGTIKEILIDDAEPVEYEQPLFVIDPS